MNERQQRFLDAYLLDPNATKAAQAAGYSAKTAYSQGQRLLKNAEVAKALDAARDAAEQKTGLTREWVLERLRENVERAMQAEPVLDREGNETGEYTYQGAAANKALELIGKHLGMFSEKVEHSGTITHKHQVWKLGDREVSF